MPTTEEQKARNKINNDKAKAKRLAKATLTEAVKNMKLRKEAKKELETKKTAKATIAGAVKGRIARTVADKLRSDKTLLKRTVKGIKTVVEKAKKIADDEASAKPTSVAGAKSKSPTKVSPKKATITSIKDANGKWSIIRTFFDEDGVSPTMRMPFEYFNELEIVEVGGGHSVKRAKKLGKSIATMNGGEVVYKYFLQDALQDTDTGRYLRNLIDDAMGIRARTTLDWGLTGLLLEDTTKNQKELFWISSDNSKAYNFAITGHYRINELKREARERAEPTRAERERELQRTMAMDENRRRIVKMSKMGAK